MYYSVICPVIIMNIEHHSNPSHQPPKKEITPACAKEMTFVKPSHTDLKDTCEHKSVGFTSEFDPRIPVHRTLEKDAVMNLVAVHSASVPNCTGLKQFWESKGVSALQSGFNSH